MAVKTLFPRIVSSGDTTAIVKSLLRDGTPSSYIEPSVWGGEVALAILESGCRAVNLQTPVHAVAEAWNDFCMGEMEQGTGASLSSRWKKYVSHRAEVFAEAATAWSERHYRTDTFMLLAYGGRLPLRFGEAAGRGEILKESYPDISQPVRLSPPTQEEFYAMRTAWFGQQVYGAPRPQTVFVSSFGTRDFFSCLEEPKGAKVFVDLRVYPDHLSSLVEGVCSSPYDFRLLAKETQMGSLAKKGLKREVLPSGLLLLSR